MKLIYTEEELPQRSPEWHEFRTNTIGASEISTVLGLLEKYEKPHTFWKRKIGKLKPKKENALMLHGKNKEDEALEKLTAYLESTAGETYNFEKLVAVHPEFRFLSASFDGVDLEKKAVVELKCPGFVWIFRSVFEDGIPDYYYPQIQMQLHIANAHWGIDKGFFCSYYPDGAYILNQFTYVEHLKKIVVIDVEYDKKYCENMIKPLAIFWEMVQNKEWDAETYKSAIKEFKETL